MSRDVGSCTAFAASITRLTSFAVISLSGSETATTPWEFNDAMCDPPMFTKTWVTDVPPYAPLIQERLRLHRWLLQCLPLGFFEDRERGEVETPITRTSPSSVMEAISVTILDEPISIALIILSLAIVIKFLTLWVVYNVDRAMKSTLLYFVIIGLV